MQKSHRYTGGYRKDMFVFEWSSFFSSEVRVMLLITSQLTSPEPEVRARESKSLEARVQANDSHCECAQISMAKPRLTIRVR